MSLLRENFMRMFRRRRYVPPPPPPLQVLPLPHELKRQYTEPPPQRQNVKRKLLWQKNDVNDKAAPKFRVYEQHDDTRNRCSWFIQVFDINFKAIFDNDGPITNYAIVHEIYDRYHHTTRGRASTIGKRIRRRPVNFQQKFMRKFRQHIGVLPFMGSTLAGAAVQGVSEKVALLQTLYDIYIDPEITSLKPTADRAVISIFLREIDAFLMSLHATPYELGVQLLDLRRSYVLYMVQWYLLAAMVAIYNDEKRPCSNGAFFKAIHDSILKNFRMTLNENRLSTTSDDEPLTPVGQLRNELFQLGRASKKLTRQKSLKQQSVTQDPPVPPSFSRRSTSTAPSVPPSFGRRSRSTAPSVPPSLGRRSSSAVPRSLSPLGGGGSVQKTASDETQDWDNPQNDISYDQKTYTPLQKQTRANIEQRLGSDKPFESQAQLLEMRFLLTDTLKRFAVLKWHKDLLKKINQQLKLVQQGKAQQVKAQQVKVQQVKVQQGKD